MDYAEQLLTGLDYVIQARLKEHKFDETIICTIVDNAKANEGLYVVSDGTIKFDAYSESIDYKVDQAVRVNIPKGDYSQKKYIVGRAVSEKNGNQPIVYNAPSAQILDISNNVFPSGAGRNWSIFANADGNKPTEKLIKSINLRDEYGGLIYDTLYLKASFKTIFNQYAICAGGYGLYIKATMSSKDESGKQNQRIYYLDSKHMFGNPYNYLISSSQETNFFIGKDESITNIEVYLYQDGGFKYKDDAGNIKIYSKSKFAEDIIVSDIYIGLGVDLIQVEDNKAEIQTAESLNYNDPTTDVDNTKIIRLQWYNKDENNQYIGFSDGIVPESTEENELDYAKRLSEHNRIVAQMKKDGVPDDYAGFELNARCEEIQTIWKTLRTLIDKDLYSEIKKFRNALNGKAKDEFADWIADIDGGINSDTGYNIEIKKQFENLLDFYKNGLSFAEKAQIGLIVYKEEEKEGEIYKYYFENDTDEILIKPSGLRSIENQLLGKITDHDWLAYNNQEENVQIPAGSLNELEKCINDSLTSIETAIAADTNLRSVYDSYKIKIEKIRDKIIAERDTLKALICGNLYRIEIDLDNSQGEDTTADYYTSWYLFEDPLNQQNGQNGQGLLTNRLIIDEEGKVSLKKKPYDPSKFDTKSNQYSIYWYYYRDGYKATDGENYLGGDNWCAIEDPNTINGKPRFEVFNENDNIGLPAPVENKETGELEYPAKPKIDDENGYLTISFSKERPDIKKEKIKAVLIYNHEKYESNIITFENKDPAAGPELTNDIQIVHGSNSKDVYSLYGVDNTLISASEFNTKRQLKVQYLNERGEPESGDETVLKGASIYWYVPTYATMLRTYDADLIASSGQSENFTKGSAVDWDFQVETEMAGEDGEKEYVTSCKLIYKTERPTFKGDVDSDLFVYKGTTYSISNNTFILSDGGKVAKDDNDNPTKVTITYTYTYNNDHQWFDIKIGPGIDDKIPLSYGGITYLISNDGKYILSSDGTKYRIQNNTVTLPIDMIDQDDCKGYEYYYKRIEDVSDLTFTYRIKDYYSASFTNNTIKCKIIKGNQQLEGSISMDFNSYGSNGTSYSLIIKPLPLTTADINWDKVTNVESGEEVSWIYNNRTFEIMLFDYENKQIPFNSAPTVKITGKNAPKNVTIEPNASNEGGVLSYITNKIKVPHYGYQPWILEVTSKQPWPLNSDNSVELKSFYPIPLSGIGTEANPGPYQGDFPTTIVYDSLGGTPSYYKDPLTLYDKNGNLVENCVWSIQYYDDSGQLDTTDEDNRKKIKFSPQLQGDANGKAKLIPNIMYISNNTICTVLKCATKDAGFRWLQPLVICQNRYPSAMLNNWDGGLKIDEDNNRILTNIVGAGKKESDNSFSGILMGEVENTDIPTDTIRNDLQHPHTGTGLYGFHQGEQSFGFNVNGTAFIGKSGGGRVAFDGTHGFIYSGNWLSSFKDENGAYIKNPFNQNESTKEVTLNQGTAGMAIDLQNGHIDAYNFKLTSAGIQLNSNPDEGEDYIYIGPNDSTQPHIRYAKGGELEIAVNSLAITGVVGGSNLLNNTAPKEALHLPPGTQPGDHIALERWHSIPKADDEGTNGQNQRCITKISRSNNGKSWIIMDNHLNEDGTEDQNQTLRTLYQYIDPSDNKDSVSNFSQGKYTLSGTIYSGASRKVIFHLGSWSLDKGMVSSTEILVNGGYKSFHHTFDITSNNVPKIFWISDSYNGDPNAMVDNIKTNTLGTYFNHLKLEKGTVVTPWDESDVDGYTLSVADQINQDIVFNKLTNNGETKGIWLTNNQLYINATYISSGILRSNNWNGVFKKGDQQITSSDYENLSNADKAKVTISDYTQGTYMNLNTGELYIGQDSGSYIRYENGSLKIKVNEFSLTSGAIGGQNLLNNTAPKEALDLSPGTQPETPIDVKYWYTIPKSADGKNQRCTKKVARTKDGRTWFVIDNYLTDQGENSSQTHRTVYHYLDPVNKKNVFFPQGVYTLSGTVYSAGERSVTFSAGYWDYQIGTVAVSGFQSFSFTFEIKADNIPYMYTINDQYNGGDSTLATWFNGLKLEKGAVATNWQPSQIDIEDGYTDAINDYDSTLNQEAVFNKLFGDDHEGVELSNGHLYINASLIATDGLISKDNSSIKISFANNTFQVRAWNDADGGIIIRSNPTFPATSLLVSESMFIIGNGQGSNKSFIRYRFKRNTSTGTPQGYLTIHTQNFKVTEDGDVSVEGKITATSGTIGGCTISSNKLSGTGWELTSTGGKIGGWSISNTGFTGVDTATAIRTDGTFNFQNGGYYVGFQKWESNTVPTFALNTNLQIIGGSLTIGGTQLTETILQELKDIANLDLTSGFTVNATEAGTQGPYTLKGHLAIIYNKLSKLGQ